MRDKLKQTIEKINILGPWVHGYFELPCGLIIKDSDSYQRARLFFLRDQFIKILNEYFSSGKLSKKTICDIGCNTGYFLFELFKKYNFSYAKGLDPRKKNIDKARFIAKQFGLPKERYSLGVGNIFKLNKIQKYDIVIVPGVFHHLDDHILACKNLFEITNDLLIIETMALPSKFESQDMAFHLELKDDVYKKNAPLIFGVTGQKFESEFLDGAAAQSGIVSIPSKNAIYLALFNAGFEKIEVIDIDVPFDSYDQDCVQYRNFCNVLAVAVKPSKKDNKNFFEKNTASVQAGEIENSMPLSIIEPLYQLVMGEIRADLLEGEAAYIWSNFVLERIQENNSSIYKDKNYYKILLGLSHQPYDKIRFEYAKSLFKVGKISTAKLVLDDVIGTVNCDWRTVYRSYHLLSLIAYFEKKIEDSIVFNRKALKTHPNFFPAIDFQKKLQKIIQEK